MRIGTTLAFNGAKRVSGKQIKNGLPGTILKTGQLIIIGVNSNEKLPK
jgi:hypothetical protein